MALPTISAGDLLNKGTTGMPANPELSVADLQAKFDELSLDVIVPKFQSLVTALENASAGADLGVTAPTGITASNKIKSVLDAMAVILLALKGKSDGSYDDLVSLFAGITTVSDVIDGLSSTIPTAKAITDFIQDIGGGDMLKAVYDTNLSGIVDNSEKLGGYSLDQLSLTASKTFFVRPTASDAEGDGTNGSSYRSISKAISAIPKNLNGYEVNIDVANGTYTDNITIKGFHGGRLNINLFTNGTVTLNGYIYIESSSEINIGGADANLIINNTVVNGGINIDSNSSVRLIQILLTVNGSVGTNGIFVNGHSSLYIDSGAFTANNCFSGIVCMHNSECHTPTIAGSGNMNGIVVYSGGKVSYGTNSISATNPVVITNGGIVTNDLVTKTEVLRHYILWTNPSPTSSFSPQPVTLSEAIENFSYYEIVYANNNLTSAAQLNSGKIESGKRTILYLAITEAYYRSVLSVSGTSIEFGASNTVLYSGSSSVDNTKMIPIKIIGYK